MGVEVPQFGGFGLGKTQPGSIESFFFNWLSFLSISTWSPSRPITIMLSVVGTTDASCLHPLRRLYPIRERQRQEGVADVEDRIMIGLDSLTDGEKTTRKIDF